MKVLTRIAIYTLLGVMILPLAVAQSYTFTDLGTLGGLNGSGAFGLNDKGWAVGYSYIPEDGGDPVFDAFLWTPAGGMHDLGWGLYGSASAINDSRQIVGGIFENAVLWTRSGGVLYLGSLGGFSGASAINALGDVAGASGLTPDDHTIHPFLWTSAGGMQDLGSFGGSSSYANGINRRDEVVGYSNLPGNQIYHAFIWTPTDGMVDLGTLGGSSSYAQAINDAGVVVGTSQLPGDTENHAFMWTRARGMRDLGTLGGPLSYARGINNRNQVVGWADTPNTRVAFLWTREKGMVNLGRSIPPTPGFTLLGAENINNVGQIVGDGIYRSQPRAFLLTPVDSSVH